MTQPSRGVPHPVTLPLAGELISGKYELVRVIGEGGMGVVYEALHTRLQQRAAIKMLQPRVQSMPDVVARFEREARAACRLRSRHAVRILDVDQAQNGLSYMVMEYLEGHDLSTELHERSRLPVTEAVDYLLQACVAMAEAHQSGVIHRDLKPSNLFLTEEHGRRIVKVLDFGISKMTSETEANVTSTFATMGTPLYMSPEQIRSAKNVDSRTDIWSLGVILFEALTGERPFSGTTTAAAAAIVADPPPSMGQLVHGIPEALEAAVMRALAKKPDERFPDVRTFAESIAAFASDQEPIRLLRAEPTSLAPPRLPGAQRPSSTPSFVHAATVEAQPTPVLSGRTPSPLIAAPPASTTAGWSSVERRAAGRGKAKVIGGAVVVAVIAAAIAVGVSRSGKRVEIARDASAPVMASAVEAPSASASALVQTIPSAAAPSATPPAPLPTPLPLIAPSPPRRHGPSPTPPPQPAPSPPQPAHATPPPPAPTNPLHL